MQKWAPARRRSKYVPRKSPKARTGIQHDGNTWVELLVHTRQPPYKNRSLFYSTATRHAYWDEPPTGASQVVLLPQRLLVSGDVPVPDEPTAVSHTDVATESTKWRVFRWKHWHNLWHHTVIVQKTVRQGKAFQSVQSILMGLPSKFFPFKVAPFSHASVFQNSTKPTPLKSPESL